MKLKRNVKKITKTLAAGIFVGGMMFSGANDADAANVVLNGGFEDGSAWTNIGGNYSHPYGGIFGPQLPEVGTLNDYGFNDDLSADAGNGFHGLAFPTTQTVSLVSENLTAAQIAAGDGRFAFSSWLATCCNDVPKLTLTFNDQAATTVTFNRGITTYMITSADVLVNPDGPDNDTSLGVIDDNNRRYWALYEFKGIIPADATEATITLDDGRAEAAAEGANTGGNGNDNYADMVILDTVAVVSGFRITEIEFTPPDQVTLTFNGNVGVDYSLFGSDDLSAWSEIDDSVTGAGEGTKFHFTDTESTFPDSRFYRFTTQ